MRHILKQTLAYLLGRALMYSAKEHCRKRRLHKITHAGEILEENGTRQYTRASLNPNKRHSCLSSQKFLIKSLSLDNNLPSVTLCHVLFQ